MSPKIRLIYLGFFICLSLPTAVFSQIGGSGWSPLQVIFNVQSPTNAPQSTRYFFTNNIYHCLTYSNDGAFSVGNTTLPRTEQRFTPDYTNGEIQYQATLMAPSNENSYCVFQIHTGDAESDAYGSTTFMLFWFTNNNGSVHDYSGTTLATNLGNQWFQLNVDHSLVSHAIKVWINQQLVWTQQDNGADDFYMKDGVYEQSHNPTYEMDTYITNTIKLWVSPGTNPPPSAADWTNTATAVAQSWNVNGNWINTSAFPDSLGEWAVVNANIAAPQTINLNQIITLGALQIGAANGLAGYTLAANGGALVFGGTNTAWLTQLAASKGDVLATPVSLAINLIILNDSTNPLTLAGMLTGSGVSALTLSGGALQVGDGTTNGSLGMLNVTNNGTLIFDRSDNVTVAGVISGSGFLSQIGAGILTASGTNTYSGGTLVDSGTLQAGNASAFGAGGGNIWVTNGGTLDVNGNNLTGAPVIVSGGGVNGGGAVVNSGAQQTSALRQLTLAGNTIFGGSNRWDLRNSGGTASLNTSPAGSPFNLTKVGTNQVSLVGVSVIEPMLGDIDIQQGELAIQTSTAQMGNPAATLTVYSNAMLELWALNSSPLNKRIVLNNGATVFNENGDSDITGPATLNGGDTFNIGGTSLTVSNAVSGNGSLVKIGTAALNLTGTNTYTGSTLVSNGTIFLIANGSISDSSNLNVSAGATLDASGRGDQTLSLGSGQTLTGSGAVNGNVMVGGGAVLKPGGALTTLTFNNNLTLNGGSVTVMEINKSSSPSNDEAQVAGSLIYGGTLIITNIGTIPFSAGDSFKLFNAADYSGVFTNIVPAIPGVNLAWSLNGGVLDVVVAPTAPPAFAGVAAGGNNLVFSGSNGVPDWPYYVLTSTNVRLPVNQWLPVRTNVFDAGGNFIFTNPFSVGLPQQFYLLKIP